MDDYGDNNNHNKRIDFTSDIETLKSFSSREGQKIAGPEFFVTLLNDYQEYTIKR